MSNLIIHFPEEAMDSGRIGYQYCIVTEEQDNGEQRKKCVKIEELIKGLESAQRKEKKYISLGAPVDAMIDIKLAEIEPLSAEVFLYLPESRRKLTYEKTSYEPILPNMLMKIKIVECMVKYAEIYCLGENMTLEKTRRLFFGGTFQKYKFPLGNVSGNRRICFGHNVLPKISSFRQITSLVNLFFDAPGNSDHYSKENTKLNEPEIRRVYEYLENQEHFPYEILTELN